MKHLGDITKINGAEITPVDCIIGGSPCQDLSVAGKRAGLDGERSGLFMEQIRIVKEMRENDRRTNDNIRCVRPRHLVWENVPGALSSPGKRNGEDHRGEDFQAVLTEIARIAEPNAPVVPLPENRRWPKSGCIMGYGADGCPFSIAWRLFDAQFWGATQYVDGRMLTRGTPQRRRRIALVADFGGVSAPEILFVRKGVCWNPPAGGEKEKGTAGDIGNGAESASRGGVEYRRKNGTDLHPQRTGKHIGPERLQAATSSLHTAKNTIVKNGGVGG